jgi:hypothetical protein
MRTLATVATFLLTLAVNAAANALPLNGQTTAEISDRFHVFVIPAGYVFAIWGLIYAASRSRKPTRRSCRGSRARRRRGSVCSSW